MDQLLDDERLSGPQLVHVNLRPRRVAEVIPTDDIGHLYAQIERLCQIWGGAATPILPFNQLGMISHLYSQVLPGSAIDNVRGSEYNALHQRPVSPLSVKLPETRYENGSQLAVALLKYESQSSYLPLDVPILDCADPWFGIYAACVGLLPQKPDPLILRENDLVPTLNFDDFVNVTREPITGSLNDLRTRLIAARRTTPRRLAMANLAYGMSPQKSIRLEPYALPDSQFSVWDGGPNLLVVCTPGNVDDLALLWNLRAAHGDTYLGPIGLPLDAASQEGIVSLSQSPELARHGSSAHLLYVTSVSIASDELRGRFGHLGPTVKVALPEEILTLGPAPGWHRDEILLFTDGEATIVPVPGHLRETVQSEAPLTRFVRMKIDLEVAAAPFPAANDLRVGNFNDTFSGGRLARSVSWSDSTSDTINWPSRLLGLRTLTASRGLTVATSEPGQAALTALDSLENQWELEMLAHGPLLSLLDEMASRTGMSWARKKTRERGAAASELERAVAPTVDDLPERSFDSFKQRLNNNTKAAEAWLLWAEMRGFIVKGFSLVCSLCHSKQWIPIGAFAPPIVCRGCGQRMVTPFGSKTQISFRYRLSERLRRVYEHDAIGHLLTMRYFCAFYSAPVGRSPFIGAHPGLNVRKTGKAKVEGEADVLLLFRHDGAVPIEVKRSYDGVVNAEVDKLDHLAQLLGSPWSALGVMQYGRDAPPGFVAREARDLTKSPFRLILTYDRLLEPRPYWQLGEDPFGWSPLSDNDIRLRESEFVARVAAWEPQGSRRWLEASLLSDPATAKQLTEVLTPPTVEAETT